MNVLMSIYLFLILIQIVPVFPYQGMVESYNGEGISPFHWAVPGYMIDLLMSRVARFLHCQDEYSPGLALRASWIARA